MKRAIAVLALLLTTTACSPGEPEPIEAGQSVEVGDWTVTIGERDTRVGAANVEARRVKPGETVIAVPVEATYGGERMTTVRESLTFYYVADGATYAADPLGVMGGDSLLGTDPLLGGGTAQGYLLFFAPDGLGGFLIEETS